MSGAPIPSRVRVLLFSDIVGSTELKSRLGTAGYWPLLERHNELFRQACAGVRGARIAKHTGDGFLALFDAASDAVRAALLFQAAMRDEPWQPVRLTTRVGIHTGEVAEVEMAGHQDVSGLAADLAARVMSLACAGQILLTRWPFNDARQFVPEHPDQKDGRPPRSLRWIAHGPYLFKGSDEPLEVFEVGAEGLAPLSAPAGADKARRVVPHEQEPTLGWRPAVGLEIEGRPGWALERKLGEGGFGEVWLAQNRRTKERRVFKFCFDAERLRSFKRELTLFKLLRDALGERKDIARLYDVKLDRAPFYLESEYAAGGNLREWAEAKGGIDKTPLPQRLEIVARVADALAAAHSVGILHKDVKPSNVLMGASGDGEAAPMLADFGIGILTDRGQLAARQITETGFTLITQNDSSRTGTRMYSPPELLTGRPFMVQGDVYALGVLLYQMVVAELDRPLAVGWEREVEDELLRDDIAACVDGEPDNRLPGAAELSRRLRGLEARRQERRRDAQAAAATRRRKRLMRSALVGCVLLVILGSAGATAALLHIRRLRAAETKTRLALQDTQREKGRADIAAAEVRRRLAEQYRDEGVRAAESDPALALLWFMRCIEAAKGDTAAEWRGRVGFAVALQMLPRLLDEPLPKLPGLAARGGTAVPHAAAGDAEPR